MLAAGVLALVCIFIAFNFWFIQNTNSIIESLVSTKSKGRLHLKLSKSKFRYVGKKLELYDAVFYSASDSGTATTYQFNIPRLDLKVRSLWAFLAYRELLIDSIALRSPEAIVTRISKTAKHDRTDVSIPEEIGRFYNSILDALQVLQVKRFQIDNGKFILVNNMDSGRPVTAISNIHFHINNLNIKADSAQAQKFFYSDNVVLRVRNQDIQFPDGVHHMSFKNLAINVQQKQVQLDSCWIKAETREDKNSFRIFFDVLKLTNLDFAALYRKNLIKADSVYVNNPDIELALELKHKKEKGKKLELDTIIQQFTGDLALGYIGVQNATVNITANRSDTMTTFRSTNDNFKMFGLRVNSDSARPVQVDEFAMILRKYETYSRDSSAVYRFDSLRFTNNKVRLSNFTIQSIGNSAKGNLYYSIPAFEVTGLSWEDLLFDRYISAEKAVLFNPEIQYTIGASRKKQSSSLFRILSGLNETVDLAQVEIRNGNLAIQLPGQKKLDLQHVDLVLASNALLASKSYTGMQQAINSLAFRNAVFTTGNLRAELINLHYADRLYADELRINNTDKSIVAQANGISLNDIVWNNDTKSVFVDHLAWQRANVVLHTGSKKEALQKRNAIIELNNLSGRNTALTVYANGNILKTNVDAFSLNQFIKNGAAPVVITGLNTSGKRLTVEAPAFQVQSGAYHIVDGGTSSIRDLSFLKQSPGDTIAFTVPQTFSKPHIQELLQGRLHFETLTAIAPVLHIGKNGEAATAHTKPKRTLPDVSIEELRLRQPSVDFLKHDSATTAINWTGKSATNYWTFYNLHTVPQKATIAMSKAELSGANVLFSRAGKQFGVDSGLVRFTFGKSSAVISDSIRWTAHLQEALFQNPISLALKRGSGIGLDKAIVRNLQLSSAKKNIYQLLQTNPEMQMNIIEGSYRNATSNLQWKNLLYSQSNQSLSIDSFMYQPALSRDSFIANAPGQTDYIHGVLKKIEIDGINLSAFQQDSIFAARKVSINDPELQVYRDKRKPYISGGLRPLPVLALQTMPAKMMIDTVAVTNATVVYTEQSDKTGQEGTVSVNRINAQLFPVRNVHIGAQDSLTLRAEGYLMDSAWLRLRLKEAYTDSLGTFAMTLRVKPADLAVLNPVLMPLASVKIASGALDTLTMRAIGNEYFSIGSMQLFYKNLKVQFLKKGSETKKTFLTGLITFAANNFVIKKNNDKRTGTVYFLRNRDRSVFNFLIKSTLSGIASSVGAKKNKKYFRLYKRQQKLYKLPPVELT